MRLIRLCPLIGVLALMSVGCASWFRSDSSAVTPVWQTKPATPPARPVPSARPEPAAPVGAQSIRVQLMQGQSSIAFDTTQPATLRHGDEQLTLRSGSWQLRPTGVTPARRRFHVFVKTFPPAARDQADAFVAQWKAQGQAPEIIAMGRRFRSEQGRELDDQILWISINRYATQADAEAAKRTLESQKLWGWIQPEIVQPGSGVASIEASGGAVAQRLKLPLTIHANAPITIQNVQHGFESSQKETRSYSGALEVGVGADGLLAITEIAPLEDYLAGVLPAEMPASWPAEALKAQAVAARSDTVANLSLKHTLEGFDYCATEHCKAYSGFGARRPTTDQAVSSTKGEVLSDGRRVIPTVFSANCGGWTENNEAVWSSPPDPALRGVSDLTGESAPPANAGRWVTSTPSAFCGGDAKTFRWSKRFTAAELTALVNKKYAVGAVREIVPGERGVSGRLKSLRVVGAAKTETIQKELPIRLAFGGLPSAMFTVDRKAEPGGAAVFVFTGGGRGHGVGLCQQGARGRASAGQRYAEILKHYFTGVTTERVR